MRFYRHNESERRVVSRWRQWYPFVLLLLVGASRWLLAVAHPENESTPASGALGCAWAALLMVALRQNPVRVQDSLPGQTSALSAGRGRMLAGALFFGGPAMPLLIGGRGLNGGAVTIALALTPVVIAIATAALGTEFAASAPGRVWPGLAAVAGLLLILIQPNLADARSDAALLLAPVLTGVGAALFCASGPDAVRPSHMVSSGTPRSLLGREWVAAELSGLRAGAADCEFPLIAPLVGGVLLLCSGTAIRWWTTGTRPVVALSAVACDGVTALLGLYALARLGPTRWSSQFALLPLLILLEGLVLVRPELTLRMIEGLGLLLLASVSLLLPPQADAQEGPVVVPR